MHRYVGIFCFIVAGAFFAGCSPPPLQAPPVVPVKGTVTLDGQPMPSGEIRFAMPGFPANTMDIKDGAYSGQASIGKNQVEVVRMTEKGFTTTEPKTPIMVNTISAKFSGPNTPLGAEVTKDGKNEFEFKVTTN